MNIVDQKIVDETTAKALASPRKRCNYNVHGPTERIQRMLQVVLKDTYFPPHQHAEKLEFFIGLSGKFAVVTFNDEGRLNECAVVGDDIKMAEVPSGSWHSVVVLTPQASFIEVIDGFYDPVTHKQFASWAPAENTPEAAAYLEDLRQQVLQQ